jgi:hypothetical protein
MAWPNPAEWSDEDWRNLLDSGWRSAHLLGTQVWTKVFYIVLSCVLLIWGFFRRRELLQQWQQL